MKALLIVLLAGCLGACGSGGPPPPDWKSDAADLIERYKKHALRGENTLAEGYFSQAVAASGGAAQVETTARLWLVRCAVRRAMLVDDACNEYRELAAFTQSPADAAYYRYLTLDWQGLDSAALPKPHAAIPGKTGAARNAAIAAIDDPLTRLLAASLSVQRKEADAATLALAADTASERGWRQPLLVYLKLQLAAASGEPATLKFIERKIRLVEESLAAQ
jgi:hypothetical protein